MIKAKYSIREYGVISEGINQNPYNVNSIEVDAETFSSLSDFVEENYENKDFEAAFLIFKKRGRRHIRVKNYVGVIETKQGVAIEILPKTYKNEFLVTEEESKHLLIRLLKALRNSPFINLNAAHLKSVKNFPILEIFITAYLDELTTLIDQQLRGDYELLENNLRYIRGKLLVTQNIKNNSFRKTHFFCSYDEFSENIPPNKLIKSTLIHLLRVSKYSKNKSRVIKLLDIFQNIDFSFSVDADLSLSRGNIKFLGKYKTLLLWSETYLKNKSFTTFHGSSINQAILFPMEKLFENYIAFLVKKYCNGLSISTQDRRYSLVGQKTSSEDNSFGRQLFQLRPDIVIDDDLLIIDTKWKLINENSNKYDIQESDLYQMNAYGRRYQSSNSNKRPPRLGLIYPQNPNFKNDLLQMRYGEDLYLNIAPFNFLAEPELEIKRIIRSMY